MKSTLMNKPFLFSVAEESAGTEENIKAFRKAIAGKKVLFIELTSENIQQVIQKGKFSHAPFVAAYQKLVMLAHKAGLKIIPLDEQKKVNELVRAEISATILSHNPSLDLRNKEIEYYLAYNERERIWIRKLKTANAQAIAVMAPGHASEIAKKLRIPEENMIGKVQDRSSHRELAASEAARRKQETAIMKRLEAEQGLGKFGSFAKRRWARRRG